MKKWLYLVGMFFWVGGMVAMCESPINVSGVDSRDIAGQQDDADEDEEELEPEITIGDACSGPGTYQCRCGDTQMGCQSVDKCKSYCSLD